MLIFEGKLSKKNQKRIIKKTFCIACLSIVFSLVVVSTIVLIFGREFIDIAIIVVPLAELIVFLIVFFLLFFRVFFWLLVVLFLVYIFSDLIFLCFMLVFLFFFCFLE